VLLRAKLIGGMPSGLVGALSGLVQGRFPSRHARGMRMMGLSGWRPGGCMVGNASIPIDSGSQRATSIFARERSPVIAVNDGKVVKIGP